MTARVASRALWLSAVLLGSASVSACAAIWGFQDSVDAGSDGGSDGQRAEGGQDGARDGGHHDTGSDRDAATHSDAHSDAHDAAVDVSGLCAPIMDAALYVTPTGNDIGTCGGLSNPCKSIGYALGMVSADSGIQRILITEGSYGESFTLQPGLSLVGGWVLDGGAWVQDPSDASAAKLVVQPLAGGTTVTADSLDGAAALCNMTIASKPTADPGETLYGVFATAASGETALLLENVVVVVTSGGNGVPGSPGSGGATGAGDCDGGNGSPGMPVGMAGAPGSGSFTAAGFQPGNGQEGSPGAAGNDGTKGWAGQCLTCVGSCPALSLCSPGMTSKECGDAGSAGCGGKGGGPGSGGGGGGSSVGVFASSGAQVALQGSRVVVGNGGNGAAGGAGGDGGAGGLGLVGASGAPCDTACVTCTGLLCCTPGTPSSPMGGDAGGPGGNGAAGGTGGGGSGGFSCPLAADKSAIVSLETSSTKSGSGGTGANGAPSGRNGGDAGLCSF